MLLYAAPSHAFTVISSEGSSPSRGTCGFTAEGDARQLTLEVGGVALAVLEMM